MLKVLVIDDEKPARAELAHLLQSEPLVESVDEAASVKEAIAKMLTEVEKNGNFDLLLLDINMPEINGMQFAQKLKAFKNPPLIIFVTAYSEYAFAAFGVDAVHYLLKPVEKQCLHDALYKAMTILVSRKHAPATKSSTQKIWVKGGEGKKYIETRLIDYVEAQKDLCKVHMGDKIFERAISLQAIQKELPQDFCLIHRGILVNMSRIDSFEKTNDGAQVILETDGNVRKLPVARRRIHEIKTTLGIS